MELNDIPNWHTTELDKRITDYRNNTVQTLDFDACMDAIDKAL